MSYESPLLSIQAARQLRTQQINDAEDFRLARLATSTNRGGPPRGTRLRFRGSLRRRSA
jgi:hypothetical protein